MTVSRLADRVADALPVSPSGSGDLDRALAFLGAECDADAVAAVATVLATTGVVAGAVAGLVVRSVVPVAVGTLVGSGVGYAAVAVPRWLATARRSRALGSVPDLVGFAVLRLRVEPTLEAAASFAATHGRGPLAESLDASVRRARGSPDAGLAAFADRWAEWSPSLRRAVSLLDAAVSSAPADRERLLDRAFAAVLDGTRDRTARYAESIRGPVSALYAFGVVLPLSLVAALPAVRSAGVPLSLTAVAAVFDGLLPLVLLVASAWLLARRPTAFPPAPVPRDHPDVPDRSVHAVAAAVGAAALAWFAPAALVPRWSRPILLSAAPGAALVVWFHPIVVVRNRVRDVEAGLGDALAYVGGRLSRGNSLEAALDAAGRDLTGPAGSIFATSARTGARLGVDARAALLGESGALADVPSPRTRAAAAVLAAAAAEGAHGGHVVVELADHLDALHRVEQEARRNLGTVVATLRSTACCFAPLVGGATVALAGRIGSAGVERIPDTLPTGPLGLAVGGYVVVTAVLLAALATSLDRGFDRASVGYHVGVALCSAPPVFVAAAGAAGHLL